MHKILQLENSKEKDNWEDLCVGEKDIKMDLKIWYKVVH
jgi:hypothetical protein